MQPGGLAVSPSSVQRDRPKRDRSQRARRRSRAGFTLLELMVIVTIIMIMAALAAPGMMRGMAINRAQRGIGQLARLGRRARSEAQTFGRAYVMVYAAGSSGTGRYELWRGLNDSCRSNPWGTIITAGGCDANDPDCTDVFDATQYSSPAHTIQITTPVAADRLCFEPNGDMYVQTGGSPFVLAANAIRVQVDRFDSGVGGGSTPVESRSVIFPPLSAPRVQ